MKFLALAFVLATSAFAADVKLADITSDVVEDRTEFFATIDDTTGDVVGVHYVSYRKDGKVLEDKKRPLKDIQGGIVIKKMDGRDIIKLRLGQNFNQTTGGDLELPFLNSGITGSWGTLDIKLMRQNGQFVLGDEDGEFINKLFIYGRWSRILRRIIGISYIETSVAQGLDEESKDD